MRIWDIDPCYLCRQHLLGEHRELHAIWTILVFNKKSPYAHHPETKRWKGKLAALYERHELLVKEMNRRKWNHESPLDKNLAIGFYNQTEMVNTIMEQIEILKKKECNCFTKVMV